MDVVYSQLEREKIRPIQRNAHLKIADCYNNKVASAGEVEHCAQNCSDPMRQVQQLVQHELNQFQERIGRCTLACQDEANDAISYRGASQDVAQAQMLKCAAKCVDTHIAMLKAMQAKIEKDIDSVAK